MMNEDKIVKLLKQLKEVEIDFGKSERKNKEQERNLIAAKIKAYRITHKLTQEELAKKLGLPKLQIIRWEGAKNMPTRLAMERLKAEGIV
jgi:DNA-binding XRE family transcriptional regulator